MPVDLGHGQLHVLLRPGELGKALGVLGDGGDEVALEALAVAVVEVEEALLALLLHLRGEELAEGSEVLDPIRLLAQGLLGHVRELGDAVRIHDLLAVRGLEQLVEVAVRLVDKFERALDQLLVGRAELDAQEAVLAQRAPLAAEDVVAARRYSSAFGTMACIAFRSASVGSAPAFFWATRASCARRISVERFASSMRWPSFFLSRAPRCASALIKRCF